MCYNSLSLSLSLHLHEHVFNVLKKKRKKKKQMVIIMYVTGISKIPFFVVVIVTAAVAFIWGKVEYLQEGYLNIFVTVLRSVFGQK